MSISPPSQRLVDEALSAYVDEVRGPLRTGTDRARVDERHRLALLHPEYDGFLVMYVTALADLDDVRIQPDETLMRVFTPHHAIGPLVRGQDRPIDLELHPGAIGGGPISGLIRIVDGASEEVAPPLRVTLATHRQLACTIAGAVDGPWPAAHFEQVVDELLEHGHDPAALARRIERVEAGRPDPGWPRRRWWRR